MKLKNITGELAKKVIDDKNGLDLQRLYPEISPLQLENLLETLKDWDCLNVRGKKLKHNFWKTFIKE